MTVSNQDVKKKSFIHKIFTTKEKEGSGSSDFSDCRIDSHLLFTERGRAPWKCNKTTKPLEISLILSQKLSKHNDLLLKNHEFGPNSKEILSPEKPWFPVYFGGLHSN